MTTVGTDCDADLVEQVTLNDLEPAAAFRWRVDWIDGFAYPKRREHLGASIAFMKISRNDLDFIDKMDAHDPRFGSFVLTLATEPAEPGCAS